MVSLINLINDLDSKVLVYIYIYFNEVLSVPGRSDKSGWGGGFVRGSN